MRVVTRSFLNILKLKQKWRATENKFITLQKGR